MVGTSILAPSVASLTVTGTFVYKSLPRLSKYSWGLTTTRKYKSPAGAPIVPALPLPGTRTRPPFATPAGMRTSIVSVRRTRPSPPHVLHAVLNLPVPPHPPPPRNAHSDRSRAPYAPFAPARPARGP